MKDQGSAQEHNIRDSGMPIVSEDLELILFRVRLFSLSDNSSQEFARIYENESLDALQNIHMLPLLCL